jgi:sulfite exporter TauE/SafE
MGLGISGLVIAAFAQGFLGSFHCLGMCGPFLGLIQSRSNSGVLTAILYSVSKSLSYAWIGFLLGGIGWTANRFLYSDFAFYLGLGIVFLIGLTTIFPRVSKISLSHAPQWLIGLSARFFNRTQKPVYLALGMGAISGLLPCGLLYPAYGLSFLGGGPWEASLIMVAFGMGTAPALFTLAITGAKLRNWTQTKGYRIGYGIFLVIFALYTIFNRIQLPPESPEDCHDRVEIEK